MIQGTEQNIHNTASLEGISCSFDKENLRRFLLKLQERLNAAAEFEVSKFGQRDQTDGDYEANKQLLRDGFVVRPTVTGQNGQELYGTVNDVFESVNFPDEVRSIYVNSEIWLKSRYNYVPHNSVEIYIDFLRPEIFDFSFMPSAKTPNETNIKVRGFDSTWVNGIFHEANAFLEDHRAPAPWLHRHSIYDILLWVFGYPVGFWACFKVSSLLPQAQGKMLFLVAAIYIYVFLVALVITRTLFHYARWVFPLAEYMHPRSKLIRHRAILSTLILALVSDVVYDIIKAALNR